MTTLLGSSEKARELQKTRQKLAIDLGRAGRVCAWGG
jgi:hypothetical protein